ncbi:MAG TPA: nicotinate-nucleotide adenylyltransferase [Alphaproteobacteria bacterium]|nr:nicotinate-nucleotide adenylyltransferase [Alphaproteobacteria bacterium]
MSSAGRVRFVPSGRPRPRLVPRRVGILGGSFNPAHEGHLEISRTALRRLDLDQVWWVVSPQNPLKAPEGMASLEERMSSARTLARDPRIRVTAIEQDLRTRYTADTLAALRRRFPRTRFVWLMGADNLSDVCRWERWPQIFHGMPVAVLARPSYSLKSLAAKAARRFARFRVPERGARTLAERRPPAWAFVVGRLSPLSATAIRRARGSKRR